MSKETLEWLNANTLIGFTAKRGNAWHYRASLQGDEPNHYPGPIPVPDVERRLFGWQAVSSAVYIENPVTGGLAEAPGRQAIIRSDTGDVMGIFTDGYEPHPYGEWLIGTIVAAARFRPVDRVGRAAARRRGRLGIGRGPRQCHHT